MKRYLIGLVLLAGCGSTTEAEPPVSLIEPPIPLTWEVLTIDASTPVAVYGVPVRLPAEQVTETLPPPPTTLTPTAREIVNSLPYDYVEGRDVAITAFTLVARDHGWSESTINSWVPFADDVMAKESGYCWNVRRGAIVSRNGCVLNSQGRHDDAGIAQLTSVHHGQGMWLCVEHGVCGANSVIRDPWTSFESFVWLLEREGSQPWCYSDWARGFHKCRLAPDR